MEVAATARGWESFHRRLDALRLPQRPDARVAARLAKLIAGHDERVLLLGITRELAGLGRELTAVDWNREQIERLWPSGAPGRNAVLADWREMDLGGERFTAAVGDGSLSTLECPADYARALGRVADALAPGGMLAVRCFVAPDRPETVEDVVADVLAGRETCFHATRWRLAMALAATGPNVAVAGVHAAFERAFPDRSELCRRTGWAPETVALIDAYRGSGLAYSFPSRRALIEAVASRFVNARFVSSGSYSLSERCPFLIAERA